LRLTVLAVPPVLPLIHREFALSERTIGALSGLPILLFGFAAIPGSLLIARLGARRAVIAGLLVVAVASAARGAGRRRRCCSR
jgi:MFS transporter, CP family, cyanate transporter